ncbi:hypothetical protein [Photobacterium phosphoreum]|uniref:hypothetical protein n=1 Tax=Photobacterium phosphoreum TaxID=659 RepID=UPI0039B0B31F
MVKLTKINTVESEYFIEAETDWDGIGMAIITDGTSYFTGLSGRGLSKLCGVDNATIVRIASEWTDTLQKPRITKIKKILERKNLSYSHPYLQINNNNYWPKDVCLAVLEYYALDASQGDNRIAKEQFRQLAGDAFDQQIYSAIGYNPTDGLNQDAWKKYMDRVTFNIDSLPDGFFCIFNELADLIITLGKNGLHANEKFIPDISVGIYWKKYWDNEELNNIFGEPTKYKHYYPDYFPQAKSNPQLVLCYPEDSIGRFRRWFREVYIKDGLFKNYITKQKDIKKLPLSKTKALEVIHNKYTKNSTDKFQLNIK